MKIMIRNFLGLSLALPGSFHSLHSVSVSSSMVDALWELSLIWISRFIGRPLQLSGPHHSRRGIPIRFDLTNSGDHLY